MAKALPNYKTETQSLQPALASIKSAMHYLGDIGASKFYADILPLLETVRFGSRTFVTVQSLNELIAANRRPHNLFQKLTSDAIKRTDTKGDRL